MNTNQPSTPPARDEASTSLIPAASYTALESRITALEDLFKEFLLLLRRSRMQSARAKEKVLEQTHIGQDTHRTLLDEERRADLQEVAFASKITGLKDRKNAKDGKNNRKRTSKWNEAAEPRTRRF